MLRAYARRLPTVELHATFRRLPSGAAVARWRDAVPAAFRFAPKAHMGITHRRDLEGLGDRVSAFLASLEPLAGHLGPLLFQLPHRQPDLERLEHLLSALPAPTPGCAFELHPAWHTAEVLSRLHEGGAALVTVDTDEDPGLPPRPGPLAYVRLRRARYTDRDLDGWADRLAQLRSEGTDVYAFVRHDDEGDAPRAALRIMARLQAS